MAASLNLEAGKRAVTSSDFNAALQLFEHGVSFLSSDSWAVNYDLSVQLFDAAAEAACITNNRKAVTFYSDQLVTHAKCVDDKLICLYSLTKSLRQANELQKAMHSLFTIIQQCGEELPLPIGNEKLDNEMQAMNRILRSTSNESILNKTGTKNKKVVILLKSYSELGNLLVFTKPSLIGAISLQMVNLTLKSGLTSECPLAFAFYASSLISMGDKHVNEACRLGRVALKLAEKSECSKYKSSVTCIVFSFTLWASLPLQAITEEHRVGHRAGMQSGDFLYSHLNKLCTIQCSYITGQYLTTVRKQFRDFILNNTRENNQILSGVSMLFHLQAVVLQEGEHRLDDDYVDNIPGLRKILQGMEDDAYKGGKLDTTIPLVNKIFQIQRLYFFRRLDDISFGHNNILEVISKEKHPLRPVLLMGIFYQGLASFQLARLSGNETRPKWVEYGESVLVKMTCWVSPWNFENKILLLEAEKMYIFGKFDQAKDLYTRSIKSAHDHRFITEEAIACEIAGDFFYERRDLPKSLALFKHSIKCYKEWGALAVARRVESVVHSKFGLGSIQLDSIDYSLDFVLPLQQDSSKKRLGI